ncbi:hypothetical protein [Empedobacter falsenii]|uniref:hypothetical protein n=1 Tax=Empedobacter falsenii TaxID=343874 RepID=UPI003A80FFAD
MDLKELRKLKKQELNARVLQVMEFLQNSGVVKNDIEFADAAGITKQHLTNMRINKTFFGSVDIMNICKAYNLNANYIFGIEDNMYRDLSNSKVSKTK